jgi:isopentenyl phosphate kinase
MNYSGTLPTNSNLAFLKLGGSLITDKHSPRTAREDLIKEICRELARATRGNPSLRLVLGHGSGSFGHFSGKKYRTREGVSTLKGWRGFAKVWFDAAILNKLVMENLQEAGLPALAFPPSASISAENRKIIVWDLAPIRSALDNALLPVVYGDVVFDTLLGGTILSTEDLFSHLARELRPSRILLAGSEAGVWEDFPDCTKLVQEITPASYPSLLNKINPSGAPDVTGGMQAKVEGMLELVSKYPELSVTIFSGLEPGHITKVLAGESLGTSINS